MAIFLEKPAATDLRLKILISFLPFFPLYVNHYIFRFTPGLKRNRPVGNAGSDNKIRIPPLFQSIGFRINAQPFPHSVKWKKLSAVRMAGQYQIYACGFLRVIIMGLMV